jgi:hypothetical protein
LGRAAIDALLRTPRLVAVAQISKAIGMTFEAGDIWEAGDIVIDVGTYDSPRGAGKYVVVYERQADGSLRLAVDAVSLDGDAPSALPVRGHSGTLAQA